MSSISLGVIYFGNGAPDPYNFNDIMHHMGGDVQDIHFDWVAIESETSNSTPTHYVVTKGNLAIVGHDTESIIQPVIDALDMTNTVHKNDHFASGNLVVNRYGIHVIDLDVDIDEVQFKLESHPDIWIHCIWRY